MKRSRLAHRHRPELLEDLGLGLGRHARPIILHGKADALGARGHGDPDPAPARRVPDGVVEQVQHEPMEERFVASERSLGQRLDGDLDPFMEAVLAQRAFGGGPGQVEDVE